MKGNTSNRRMVNSTGNLQIVLEDGKQGPKVIFLNS